MPDEITINDPYYRYDPLSYGRLWDGLMSGVGQTAQTAQSPQYEQWGSILEVADAWGSISDMLDGLAGSLMVSLLGLREAWSGEAAEQHEWRMSNLMTWMSSMAREAAAIRTGLMLMSNYLDEAQAEGVQVPCPRPKKSGSIWGDIVGYSAVVMTLGAAQLIPARVFGMSMTQPGSERRSSAMARVVADLAMNYLLTENRYWNGPLLSPLTLEPRGEAESIPTPSDAGGGGSQPGGFDPPPPDAYDPSQPGGGGGSQPGGFDPPPPDAYDPSQPGGYDGSQPGDDDGGTGTSSGLAAAGALGSGTSSFGSGSPSLPQAASAPMVGAVPGVLGAERLVVPAGAGGPGAGGAGPVAPPMMGMMGAGAPASGNSPDKSARPSKFWREDEIEWSRDEHAQWVDPDEKPPPALDTRRG